MYVERISFDRVVFESAPASSFHRRIASVLSPWLHVSLSPFRNRSFSLLLVSTVRSLVPHHHSPRSCCFLQVVFPQQLPGLARSFHGGFAHAGCEAGWVGYVAALPSEEGRIPFRLQPIHRDPKGVPSHGEGGKDPLDEPIVPLEKGRVDRRTSTQPRPTHADTRPRTRTQRGWTFIPTFGEEERERQIEKQAR